MNGSELTYIALLAIVAIACGLLPPLRRMGERALHVALAAATGVFLGVVFLDLLPALAHDDGSHGEPATAVAAPHDSGTHAHDGDESHDHAGHDHSGADADRAAAGNGDAGHAHAHAHGGATSRWLAVLAGLLAVYLFESLALRSLDRDDHHRHRSVAWGALIGLSIHAVVRGLEFAVPSVEADRGFLWLPLAHRGAEAFALATIFALAQIRVARSNLAIVVFAFLTPLGFCAGRLLELSHAPHALGIVQGFAAGIFLFVSLCELLPEVFHHREDGRWKVALLSAGVAAAYWSA